MPGKYRVAINPLTNPNPDKPPTKSKLPVKYENLDSSGLTVEVKPGQNNIELELDKAPPLTLRTRGRVLSRAIPLLSHVISVLP